jgi:uncharacterized protein (DUF305 family)
MLTSPRRLAALAVLVVAVASAAACSSDDGSEGGDSDQPRVVQLGAPGATNRELTGDELEALAEAPTYTAADLAFVQNMIPHHEQALTMTAMVADRTSSPALPELAERMAISQRDEIVQLQAWLTERGEPLPDEHHQHEQMPGMLTDAELAQLEAARGQEFDELFLQYMIRHHEGAVIMVESLLSDAAGGQEPAIFQLAQHIASDQQIEVSRMKQLLVEM